MREAIKEEILSICDDLICEGENLLNMINANKSYIERVYEWWAGINTLKHILGHNTPWSDILNQQPEVSDPIFVNEFLGTIKGIRYSIDNNYLDNFKDIVLEETNLDLIEQAEELLNKKYFLAAGVIFRAVLEEHLRNICRKKKIIIGKTKPSISDFNQALYKAEHYSKTRMKQIDTLASIGNNAAHNSPELTNEDVKFFSRELPPILEATK
jgi:hypothetical protein